MLSVKMSQKSMWYCYKMARVSPKVISSPSHTFTDVLPNFQDHIYTIAWGIHYIRSVPNRNQGCSSGAIPLPKRFGSRFEKGKIYHMPSDRESKDCETSRRTFLLSEIQQHPKPLEFRRYPSIE